MNADKILDFLSHYGKGTWVYPNKLSQSLSLSLVDVYEFLHELEKTGVVQSYFELSHCGVSVGTVETFSELSNTFICPVCGKEVHGIENAVIIYKMKEEIKL